MFRNDVAIDLPAFGPPRDYPVDRTVPSNWRRQLWRVRYWALGGAVSLGALALAFNQLADPVYQATAQVFIDPQNLQVLDREVSPSVSNGDAGVVLIESQSRIMASDSVLGAAVTQLGLDHDAEFVAHPSPFKTWLDGLLNGQPDSAGNDVQRATDALAKQVYVIRLDRTYIVEVHVKSASASKAAAIANAIVHQYLDLRETQRSQQARQATGALEGRLSQLLATLQANENAVETFKSANGIVEANGTLVLESDVAQSNATLAAARSAAAGASLQLDQLKTLAGQPEMLAALPEAVGSPDIIRLRGQLQAAQSAADMLATTLGQRHPKWLEANGQVQTARAALAAELVRLRTNSELTLARANDTLAAAQSQFGQSTGALQRTDTQLVHLRQLEREADASRAVYQDALLRSRQTAEQATVDTVNAQIISEATPPSSRSFPPKITVLLPLALAVGLGLGAALGLGLQRLTVARRAVRKGNRHA